MARKGLLKGLTEDTPQPATPAAAEPPQRSVRGGGAIGAVSRSIDDLRRRAVVEIDARLIDGAGLRDRLDDEGPEQEGLVASLREHGQQVPVLVRVNPNDPERYQIVYGRRRVAALRALGLPVRALVRDLDDRALILAQGQENTARKDLSFIEKVNFARQMQEVGYDRATICAALSVDKTLASRMLAVADQVPVALIEAIGAAPGIGRDRWLALAARVGQGAAVDGLVASAQGEDSRARFEAVMVAASATAEARAPKESVRETPREITGAGGAALASLQGGTLRLRTPAAFNGWLADLLPELLAEWEKDAPEKS